MSGEAARADGPVLPRCPHCGGDHPPHQLRCPETDLPLPLEGRVLHGKFRFVRQLGRGGMASVWSAVNTLVDRYVAIKLIRPEAGRDEETVARFKAEAKAAGRIGHPNVCEILDFGLGPLGPYIVMERLRGKSLGELIRDEGRLDPALAVTIVRQALAGLEAAHRRGIIHRDLKPENLFVHQPEGSTPVVKIMDFGVSKFTDGSAEVQTEHGALLGTPEYMSPEQFKGAAHADERTDVWAVGAILYKALTGETAFAGPSVAATLLMVTTEEPPPIPERVRGVPPDLIALVDRCLKKDPDERFQNVAALSEELAAFDLESLDGLMLLDVEESRQDETSASPTKVMGERKEAQRAKEPDEANSAERDRPSRHDTALPTTRPRIEPAARTPGRPDRRAWIVIVAVTLVGGALLYGLLQRGGGAEGTADAPSATPADGEARGSGAEGVPAATGEATGTTGATTGAAAASTGHESSTGASPTGDDGTATGSTGARTGSDTEASADPEEASADTEANVETGGFASDTGPAGPTATAPPPVPPGTIRVGGYITLEKPGPTGTHADARAYCKNLGKLAFVGVTEWKLASPAVASKLASRVRKGKYWTSALWHGKAKVIDLPSRDTTSRDAERKGPRALCIARWP